MSEMLNSPREVARKDKRCPSLFVIMIYEQFFEVAEAHFSSASNASFTPEFREPIKQLKKSVLCWKALPQNECMFTQHLNNPSFIKSCEHVVHMGVDELAKKIQSSECFLGLADIFIRSTTHEWNAPHWLQYLVKVGSAKTVLKTSFDIFRTITSSVQFQILSMHTAIHRMTISGALKNWG